MADNTTGQGVRLKDELFNEEKVRWLANQLTQGIPNFPRETFVRDIVISLDALELKQRIALIADVLEQYLDPNFTVAAQQIESSLPLPLDPTKTDGDFGEFIMAPLGEYVARHGCTAENISTALALLKELTQRFSMEFYIRPFIEQFPEVTVAVLNQWSRDSNYHVRRLVSEGTRPLLPWAGRLQCVQYTETLPLLTTLHTDPTRYVTRSVANHLNDISKQDPEVVLQTLSTWRQVGTQKPRERDWLERHALRTLVKQSNQKALEFLGYTTPPAIVVKKSPDHPSTVVLDDTFTFSFEITAIADVRLLVDYRLDFAKKHRGTTSKVFKITSCVLTAGDTVVISKKHHFKANTSTRTYYSGVHTIILQINGTYFESYTFTLTTAQS